MSANPTCMAGLDDRQWAWDHYLDSRTLVQADNVRAQLQRTMEKYEVELVSIADQKKMHLAVRQALCCGFFMQVAHKEGEKGNYLTVKDNQASSLRLLQIPLAEFNGMMQVVGLHPSCGLDSQPEWVMFNEFVLTTRPFIRTVTEVRPEWCVFKQPSHQQVGNG